MGALEKYIVFLTVGSFVAGILIASISEGFVNLVTEGMETFIDLYGYIAPIAIFIILTPALAKLLNSKAGKFGRYAVLWLGMRRLMASLFAVFFTVVIFGFPIMPSRSLSIEEAVMESLSTLFRMSYSSPFLLAIWVGIITAFLSVKVPQLSWLNRILDRASVGLESFGQLFVPIIPFFMFAIGGYVYALPNSVNGNINSEISGGFTFHNVDFFGFPIDPNNPLGMVGLYLLGSFLVGVACIIWHLVIVFWAKYKTDWFSVNSYFKDYWIRVYPLLWATSSEALATPLNLYLTKKHFPRISKVVRRFVVGMGSYLNINGTVICIFVLGGLVASALGIEISLVEWLLSVPLIFILSYGVPGIPGELVLFAGPLATMFNLQEPVLSAFLALYIGLQVGLPDSFRTGNNSTDDCVSAIVLNSVYEKNYAGNEEEEEDG